MASEDWKLRGIAPVPWCVRKALRQMTTQRMWTECCLIYSCCACASDVSTSQVMPVCSTFKSGRRA